VDKPPRGADPVLSRAEGRERVPIERRDTVLGWPKKRQAADRIDWLASAVRVFRSMGAIWLRRRFETRDACRACWWLV